LLLPWKPHLLNIDLRLVVGMKVKGVDERYGYDIFVRGFPGKHTRFKGNVQRSKHRLQIL